MAKAFSAPGKALLAGGYLVLDPQYKAYVVALSSRMHAVVEHAPSNESKVTVESTQFNNDKWVYKVEKNEAGNFIPVEAKNLENPFIEKTILNAFNYFQPANGIDIKISIYSDAGYHSQTDSVVKKNQFKSFNFYKETVAKVPKTGLGSSAGLVTVVTTTLVSVFLESFDLKNAETQTLVHNLAQVSHCQAQGKVGSGFDVAAATFGSILYQRFDPALINGLPDVSSSAEYRQALHQLVSKTSWNFTAEQINLPKGLKVVIGDVNNGSETTKLVAEVKEWRAHNGARAKEVYSCINEGNVRFIEGLEQLNELAEKDPESYTDVIKSIETKRTINPALLNIITGVFQARGNFRLITQESDAQVEPTSQKALLDAASELPGVLTGMIPGAGGYDAIALITTADCPVQDLAKENDFLANVTFLDLKQENAGLQEEDPTHYTNLN
ncbi:hypothetical protein ACO0QE_002324 [Hanseniaspora vineae]